MKRTISSEAILLIAIFYNSLNLSFLIKSQFGISALSSVPVAFASAFTQYTQGTWNIIIQLITIVIMAIILKRFKLSYILSFFVVLVFGFCIDLNSLFLGQLPNDLVSRILYVILGFVGTGIGAGLFIVSELPILPFDLVVREFAKEKDSNFKTVRRHYDVFSIVISISVSLIFLSTFEGVGIATVLGVFYTGKIIQWTVDTVNHHFEVVPFTKLGVFLKKQS